MMDRTEPEESLKDISTSQTPVTDDQSLRGWWWCLRLLLSADLILAGYRMIIGMSYLGVIYAGVRERKLSGDFPLTFSLATMILEQLVFTVGIFLCVLGCLHRKPAARVWLVGLGTVKIVGTLLMGAYTLRGLSAEFLAYELDIYLSHVALLLVTILMIIQPPFRLIFKQNRTPDDEPVAHDSE